MAQLQLAENYLAQAPMEFYIFVPAGYRGNDKDTYVREDLFDGLPRNEYNAIMQDLAPYQPQGLSAGDKESRKAARAEKKAGKGGAARREAKQKRVETRQAGKADRIAKGGGAANIFGKVLDTAKGFIQNKDVALDYDADGKTTIAFDPNQGGEESFFSKYKLPLLIGGGAVVAGVIYLATKKK